MWQEKKARNLLLTKDTEAPLFLLCFVLADVVNGETTIVFDVRDEGKVARAEYVLFERGEEEMIEVARNALDLDRFVISQIGTKEQPITNAMVLNLLTMQEMCAA